MLITILFALGMIGEGVSQTQPEKASPIQDPRPLPDEPIRIEKKYERLWLYDNRATLDAWRDIGPWLADTAVFRISLERLTNETWAVIVYVRKMERPVPPDGF